MNSSPAEAFARTAAYADEVVRAGTYPAAALLVSDREGPMWTYVAPGDQGVGIDSIFPVASITKPIVAVAVMQLVERGLLRLDQPVAELIPGFDLHDKGAVTVRHLLTHTSGLSEDGAALERLTEARAPIDAYFDLASGATLRFPPGTRGEYSNLGFYVLANLVTRLSKTPYPAYLRERIFQPLGMADTGFAPPDPARAAPHHATPEHLSYRFSLAKPSGGLWSTVSDLARFGRAFLVEGQALLSESTRTEMTRLQTAGVAAARGKRPPAWRLGLGWFKPDPKRPDRCEEAFGHAGSTGSLLWVDPRRGFIFVFLSNVTRTNADSGVAERALDTVYDALRAPM
jgi:CubicO group peptidase (beta-lactamase class C family)